MSLTKFSRASFSSCPSLLPLSDVLVVRPIDDSLVKAPEARLKLVAIDRIQDMAVNDVIGTSQI